MTVTNPTTTTRSPHAVRANDLTGRSITMRVYLASGSPRVLLGTTAVLFVARLAVGGWGRGDLLVAGVTVVLVGPVEWVVHRYLLHAADDAWPTRLLGTGIGHRRHHLDPPAIEWLLLRGVDAAVYVVVFGAFTALWSLPLLALTGSSLAGPFLTACTLAAVGLAHYEWVHLLVHSSYRPRSRYYARLARNHRLHHFRNEHYWLGVTANSGDRLLGTLPRSKTDVPLSDTARTLARS